MLLLLDQRLETHAGVVASPPNRRPHETVTALAHQRAARLAAYPERLPELRQQADGYSVAVPEFGIGYEQAVLSSFDDLPGEVRGA